MLIGLQLLYAAYILAAAYIPRLSWMNCNTTMYLLFSAILIFLFFHVNLKFFSKFERLYRIKENGQSSGLAESLLIILITFLLFIQPYYLPHAIALAGPWKRQVPVEEVKNNSFVSIGEITGYRFSRNGFWRYQSRVYHWKPKSNRGFYSIKTIFPLLPDRDVASPEEFLKKRIKEKTLENIFIDYRTETLPDKKLAWVYIPVTYLDPYFQLPPDTFGGIMIEEIMYEGKRKNILHGQISDKPPMTVLRADPMIVPGIADAIRKGYPGELKLTPEDMMNIYEYTPEPLGERIWVFLMTFSIFILPNLLYVIAVIKRKISSESYLPATDEEMKKLLFLNRIIFRP